jgi:hypothetical protein
MTMFHTGRQGLAVATGIELPITQWAGSFRSRLIDVTNASSGGFAEYIPGILAGRVEMRLLWDSEQLPNQSPGLVEGNSITCTLHCGATGMTFAGTVAVESVRYESIVRGPPLRLVVIGRFSGAYSRPVVS